MMKKLLILCFYPVLFFGQSEFNKAQQLVTDKDFDAAEKILLIEVESTPDNLQVIELLGDVYGAKKEWDAAIVHYKKLVDLVPENANYHYKYGGVLGMKALSVSKIKALGIIGDVKKEFHTAAALDSKHIDTRWALVKLYTELPGIIGGSTNKALKYAEELEALSLVDGYLAKGYVYNYEEDFDDAENYYKKAVAVGGSVTCYKELSTFYIAQNNTEKAIQTLTKAYDIHKTNAFLQQIKTLRDN